MQNLDLENITNKYIEISMQQELEKKLGRELNSELTEIFFNSLNEQNPQNAFEKDIVQLNRSNNHALKIAVLSVKNLFINISEKNRKRKLEEEITENKKEYDEQEKKVKYNENNITTSCTLSKRLGKKNIDPTIFSPIQRLLEKMYIDLPWPEVYKNICVYTRCVGGFGDVMAGAKAIEMLQKVCPHATIEWLIRADSEEKFAKTHPKNFLTQQSDKTTIRILYPYKDAERQTTQPPIDFMLVCPLPIWKEIKPTFLVSKELGRELKGPICTITENAFFSEAEIATSHTTENYSDVHFLLFPETTKHDPITKDWYGALSMGFEQGTGVFLNQQIINTKLCHEAGYDYLADISDEKLKSSIQLDVKYLPDYKTCSFNLGYTTHESSKALFIESVALHEREKDVILAINSKEFKSMHRILINRISWLRQQGYSRIVVTNASNNERYILSADEKKRTFHCVVYSQCAPQDMQKMQLAADRHIATGDNSAVESLCAGSKLYLYEALFHKNEFSKQQQKIASRFSPNLAKLLDLSCNSISYKSSTEERRQLQQILVDPKLAEATNAFCKHIVENFAFEEPFTAALKRTVWLHHLPALKGIEEQFFPEDAGKKLLSYYKNANAQEQEISIHNLQQLKDRIHEYIQKNQESVKKDN